jgi:hypothetical protein
LRPYIFGATATSSKKSVSSGRVARHRLRAGVRGGGWSWRSLSTRAGVYPPRARSSAASSCPDCWRT